MNYILLALFVYWLTRHWGGQGETVSILVGAFVAVTAELLYVRLSAGETKPDGNRDETPKAK